MDRITQMMNRWKIRIQCRFKPLSASVAAEVNWITTLITRQCLKITGVLRDDDKGLRHTEHQFQESPNSGMVPRNSLLSCSIHGSSLCSVTWVMTTGTRSQKVSSALDSRNSYRHCCQTSATVTITVVAPQMPRATSCEQSRSTEIVSCRRRPLVMVAARWWPSRNKTLSSTSNLWSRDSEMRWELWYLMKRIWRKIGNSLFM